MFVFPRHSKSGLLQGAIPVLVALSAALCLPLTLHAQLPSTAELLQKPDGAPNAPVIMSPLVSDQFSWYADPTEAVFTWNLPEDVTAVAVAVADSTDVEPTFVYQPPIAQYSPDADELKEGVQYIAVQFKNESGWGDIGYYRLQLDRTSPRELYLDLLPTDEKGESRLVFGAVDDLSGMSGYVVSVSNGEPVFVTPEQAMDGYPVSQEHEGTYDVVVAAYDRAGNSTSNRFPVFVLDQESMERSGPFGTSFTPEETLAFALGCLSLVSIWFALRLHFFHRGKERKLREEMYEVQEQMEKIFRALRDEIYDQVQSIRKRPRLSKGEQRVVTELDRVLEVSETLIEKEIKDVKKLLK